MNLRAVANTLTSGINPNISASVRTCVGYRTANDYSREPIYAEGVPLFIQCQSLTKREIEHLDALNLSNATQSIYANRQLTGVDRVDQSGGDLVTYTDPASGQRNVWLVIAVLEGWSASGWTKAAIARQADRA